MATSQFAHDNEEDDVEIKELVLHYEEIINELKRNKTIEMNVAN